MHRRGLVSHLSGRISTTRRSLVRLQITQELQRDSALHLRPTPDITWEKEGGELPTNRLVLQSFQKTLRISDVADSDAGRYRCTASNRLGSAHHVINVTVKGSLLLVGVQNKVAADPVLFLMI